MSWTDKTARQKKQQENSIKKYEHEALNCIIEHRKEE